MAARPSTGSAAIGIPHKDPHECARTVCRRIGLGSEVSNRGCRSHAALRRLLETPGIPGLLLPRPRVPPSAFVADGFGRSGPPRRFDRLRGGDRSFSGNIFTGLHSKRGAPGRHNGVRCAGCRDCPEKGKNAENHRCGYLTRPEPRNLGDTRNLRTWCALGEGGARRRRRIRNACPKPDLVIAQGQLYSV